MPFEITRFSDVNTWLYEGFATMANPYKTSYTVFLGTAYNIYAIENVGRLPVSEISDGMLLMRHA